jgi:hypothetical protein
MELADYWLLEKQLVHKLFKVLVPRFENCPVSYTRMYRAPRPCPGPKFKRAVLELRGEIQKSTFHLCIYLFVCVCIYIYIYIYIWVFIFPVKHNTPNNLHGVHPVVLAYTYLYYTCDVDEFLIIVVFWRTIKEGIIHQITHSDFTVHNRVYWSYCVATCFDS